MIGCLGSRNAAIFGSCLQTWGILFPLFPNVADILIWQVHFRTLKTAI